MRSVSAPCRLRIGLTVHSFDRGKVERFATLPPGEAYPEGIDTR